MPAFEEQASATFSASAQIELQIAKGTLPKIADTFDVESATVVVIDLDAARDEEMHALQRFMTKTGAWPPIVVVTQAFDADVARTLLQMRVADFLVKPVPPVELVRACARVAKASGNKHTTEAANLHLPARHGRHQRHNTGDSDSDAAAEQRQSHRPGLDLPRRPRFPARGLRRLPRH